MELYLSGGRRRKWLSKAFGSTPETWLRMQLAYDLAAARKGESKIRVRRQHAEQVHIHAG